VFKLRREEREKAKMKLKGRQIGSEKEETNKDGKKTFIVRQTKRKKRKTERLYVRVFTKRKRREREMIVFYLSCTLLHDSHSTTIDFEDFLEVLLLSSQSLCQPSFVKPGPSHHALAS
jgi:hypothetical protein